MGGQTRPMVLRVMTALLGVCALPCALGFGASVPVGVLQGARVPVGVLQGRSRALGLVGRSAVSSSTILMSSPPATAPPPEKKASPRGFDGDKIGARRYSLFPRNEDYEEMGEGPFNSKEEVYALYHHSERLVVVQYSKKMCSMCRVIKPLVEKVMKEFSGRIHYADVEVGANKAVIPQATPTPLRPVYHPQLSPDARRCLGASHDGSHPRCGWDEAQLQRLIPQCPPLVGSNFAGHVKQGRRQASSHGNFRILCGVLVCVCACVVACIYPRIFAPVWSRHSYVGLDYRVARPQSPTSLPPPVPKEPAPPHPEGGGCNLRIYMLTHERLKPRPRPHRVRFRKPQP